jgi:HK97 family phage prohead protease
MNHFYAPLELKFADADKPAGVFSGYGAVFGNVDSHGDVIRPGAFVESIAESKAAGRNVPMHVMHRGAFGGDGLPVGVWTNLTEDDRGLKVEGKISGMNTDGGRLLFERVKDGALGGLSIGYRVKPDGAILGKRTGEAKRTLTRLHLSEISLVDDPSNALSRVDEIKSAVMDEFKELMKVADVSRATAAVVAAMSLHHQTLSGSNSPSVGERQQTLAHLQDIHEALTGSRTPAGMKAAPQTLREFENFLRDECKFSHAQARSIAANGFPKTSSPRDEENEAATNAADFMKALLQNG